MDATGADSKHQGTASNEGGMGGYEMNAYPGQREPAVLAILPASVYRGPPAMSRSADKIAMLDSTPVSRSSCGARSPRFPEHLPEMEDTSFRHSQPQAPSYPYTYPAAPPSAITRITTPTTDSPTLGRQGYPQPQQSSLADDLRRKQHLMAWNNYDASHASGNAGEGEAHEMEATMVPKTPPATARSPQQISPDTLPGPSDGRGLLSALLEVWKGGRSELLGLDIGHIVGNRAIVATMTFVRSFVFLPCTCM